MRRLRIRARVLKGLAIAGAVCVVGVGAAWIWGRVPLARWAVGKAFRAAGLEPAVFQVTDVDLGGLHIANMRIGAGPWLEAGNVDVTFGIGSLMQRRVNTVQLDNVQWRVQVKDGDVDWGYRGGGRGSSVNLNLPFDQLSLSHAVIHAEVDGVPRDMQIEGLVTPRDGRVAVGLDVAGFGEQTTLMAEIGIKDSRVVIDARGELKTPTNPAKWSINGSRDLNTGAIQIDGRAEVGELLKKHAGEGFGIAYAGLDVHAMVPAQGNMNARIGLELRNMKVAGIAVGQANVRAMKGKEGEITFEVGAAGDGWDVPAMSGFVTWNPREASASKEYQISMRSEKAVVINFEEQGVTGGIATVEGRARVGYDGEHFAVRDGELSFEGGALIAGDLSVSNTRGAAHLQGTEGVEIKGLSAEVGDGSTVSLDPFVWKIGEKELASRIVITNLSLEHWLPILTDKHATGEGRISGDAAFSLEWPEGTLRLGELNGSLRADPEHGYIQATDADAVGDLLEKQDPRFATDPVMQPIREKIVNALRDFAFKKLTVDLSRTGDRTVALTYLSGFGRHGEDPQGLNLTLDLHVQDSVLDLASKLKEKSEVTKAAREALEKFFQKPAAKEKR